MELLQIVPMLPPAMSGIGDYALLLARELSERQAVRTRFLSGDPSWHSPAAVAPFAAEAVSERNAATMGRALREGLPPGGGVILLHYVGYGYARRGCPVWLVRALERWKHETPRGRLIILFHELYGTGPVWTSGFWTTALQKALATRLGRIADLNLTPTGAVAGLLRQLLAGRELPPTEVLPVFSTLGEPASISPLDRRRRRMVVFGSAGWRTAAYTRHAASLVSTCRALGIERIVSIGPPAGPIPTLPIPVDALGALPADEASAIFADSLAGFFTYPVFLLGKSTIYAAYCAHGMVPVTFAGNAPHDDEGLREGEQYLAGVDVVRAKPRFLASVAASAHAWYAAHALPVHARKIRWQIGPPASP